MYVLAVYVRLRLFESFSLKEKRRVVQSILQKMRQKYGVSSAEIDALNQLNVAGLGFSLVTNRYTHGERHLQQLIAEIEAMYPVEIIALEWINE